MGNLNGKKVLQVLPLALRPNSYMPPDICQEHLLKAVESICQTESICQIHSWIPPSAGTENGICIMKSAVLTSLKPSIGDWSCALVASGRFSKAWRSHMCPPMAFAAFRIALEHWKKQLNQKWHFFCPYETLRPGEALQGGHFFAL